MITQREIVAAFGGGDILPSGDVLVAAPGHSRRDRSLSIKPLLDGRVLVHSFSTRDGRLELLAYVEGRLGIARRRGNTPPRPLKAIRPSKPERRPPNILALWNSCVDPAGTPVETYLSRRGVLDAGRHAFGHAIRFHPSFRFDGRNVPCMVSLVTNVHTGKPQAIHRSALGIDGNKGTINGKDRMALGPIKDGCVRLTLDENVETCLGIGEGIESTLSLQCLPEFGMSPLWACLNAKSIEDFPALPGIESLWIAADNEAAGINAAHACRTRWLEAGCEVFRIQSDKENDDLNDVIAGVDNVC